MEITNRCSPVRGAEIYKLSALLPLAFFDDGYGGGVPLGEN